MRLLTRTIKETIKNINKINYSYLSSSNKFCFNTSADSSNINIVVDSHKFHYKSNDPLKHINSK